MTVIEPAKDELVALARIMRPDWDNDTFAASILAAKNAGWSWLRTFNTAVRLLADEDASPYDLKRAAASPFKREEGTPPPAEYREVRAAMQANQAEGEAS